MIRYGKPFRRRSHRRAATGFCVSVGEVEDGGSAEERFRV